MAKDSNVSQTGGGVRMSGGITAAGGKKVNPVYKESFPPSSVKVVKGTDGKSNMDKNTTANIVAQMRKSGDLARITALRYTGKPSQTIKINSK